MRKGVPLIVLAFTFVTLASSAVAAVRYTYTGPPGLDFVFDSPDFVTSVTSAGSCPSFIEGSTCTFYLFPDDGVINVHRGGDVYDAVGALLSGGGGGYVYFANGAFSAFGTYSDVFHSGSTLIVGPASVPESGTIGLLGLALAALAAARRPGNRQIRRTVGPAAAVG